MNTYYLNNNPPKLNVQFVNIGPEAELSTSMERGESREAVVITFPEVLRF